MSSRPQLAEPQRLTTLNPAAAAATWLSRLELAWRSGDAGDIEDLFAADSHWRDCLAVTGTVQTWRGAHTIADTLHHLPWRGSRFRVAEGRTPPRVVNRAGIEVIEAIFAFHSPWGPASGVLRLTTDRPEPAAWIWHTSLDGLDAVGETDHPELTPAHSFGGPDGAEQRRKYLRYADHEPTVMVIGAGHAGLGAAACLSRLGVDTLVVDRLERVGDVWRNRYDSLVLHNEAHIDHLPYLPFPSSMPRFMPRDTVADWLEAYATVLDLNVWDSTDMINAAHDGDVWSVTVRRDGQERVLHPRHLILAVGTNALPVRPSDPGLDDFTGTVLHSSDYRSGRPYAGQRVVVIGTGSSAHDIAQDLHGYGADVTMVQRGPTLVVSLAEAQKVYPVHNEGLPLADADLLSAATPYPVLVQANQIMAAAARAADHELLQGLTARGFRLDDGAPDATGFLLKLLRRGGGYYVNVGCSELIASGEVNLLHHDQIDRYVPEGVRLVDGTVLPADLIVASTGYLHQQDFVRRHLGDQVAERVGPVGGIDHSGEQRNQWRPTAQPGLWFTGGGFPQTRANSRLLALQIAMDEHGILPPCSPDTRRTPRIRPRTTSAATSRP